MLFVETQRIRNRGNGIDAEPMSTIRWSKTEYCLFRIPNSKVIPKKYIVISKKYIFPHPPIDYSIVEAIKCKAPNIYLLVALFFLAYFIYAGQKVGTDIN